MNFVNYFVKICCLIAFVFLSFESFNKNSLKLSSTSDIERVHSANLKLVSEISLDNNFSNKSRYIQNTDKYFNYSLGGIFIRSISKIFKINDITKLTHFLEVLNQSLLVFVFVLLLIWINYEFGFLPSIFSGAIILLNPYYSVLSGFITVSVFSIMLPSVLLGTLLFVERLNKTYLQKRIVSILFVSIMLRLWISYRSIFFIIFTTLLIGMYHAFYYKWERRFAINRITAFVKVMFYSFFCVCVMHIGLDTILYRNSFSEAFLSLLNNISFNMNFTQNGMQSVISSVLNYTSVFPGVSCLGVLIFFLIVSLASFLFYYNVMKIHQRQFYALFWMSFASYLMVIFSSLFEATNKLYISIMWTYPAIIFTFAILGLLIKNIYIHFSNNQGKALPNKNLVK